MLLLLQQVQSLNLNLHLGAGHVHHASDRFSSHCCLRGLLLLLLLLLLAREVEQLLVAARNNSRTETTIFFRTCIEPELVLTNFTILTINPFALGK